MAKMRPPGATLLIVIIVLSSAPQPSQSFNPYRTLLSLSPSLLKRVANLLAERGDISGSNRVKLISQKLEEGLELYGAVSNIYELMRILSELMRVDLEKGRATWVRQDYGNVLGVSKCLFVRLPKVFTQSGALREVVEILECLEVGSNVLQYSTLLSLSPSLLNRVAHLRAERSDISGSNRVKLISQKLERGLELYGAVSNLYELMRFLSELMRVDSEKGMATLVHQDYGDVLGVSKRLFVTLPKVFAQSGALREVVETVEREVVDGGLLRDCLEVASNDLKGLIQVFKDLVLQYYPSPSPDFGRDL